MLCTKNYREFGVIDTENCFKTLHSFEGALLANKCLPGDTVQFSENKISLVKRADHKNIVGVIELTSKYRYGMTSRGVPLYLFIPNQKKYPPFIVGCSEKDLSVNRIGIINFEKWDDTSQFPRGNLVKIVGMSGNVCDEKNALIHEASPLNWKGGDIVYDIVISDYKERNCIQGYTFNIDPDGCKDIDDAITILNITPDTNKLWQITISIADVAAAVTYDSEIDKKARQISQTLYDLSGNVIKPMLPPTISESYCSLLENTIRHCVSLTFIWDNETVAIVPGMTFSESIIKNNKSWTYDTIYNCSYSTILKNISSHLEKEEIHDSHKWVESLMKLYNTEAAKIFKKYGIGILRRHSAPNYEKLQKYNSWDKSLSILAQHSAEYCHSSDENTVHYGLEENAYCHITSPIRRYSDLLNQRLLKSIIIGEIPFGSAHKEHIYSLNERNKQIKKFGRDILYLYAIETKNKKTMVGRILEIKYSLATKDVIKLKIFVTDWNQIISVRLPLHIHSYNEDENRVVYISNDANDENNIILCEGDIICFNYTFNLNERYFKDRIILEIVSKQ